jgi:hypothetical protein
VEILQTIIRIDKMVLQDLVFSFYSAGI